MRSEAPLGSIPGVVPLGLGLLSNAGSDPCNVGDAVNPASAPPEAKLLASNVTVYVPGASVNR